MRNEWTFLLSCKINSNINEPMMDEWSCHKSVKGEVNGSMQLANKGLPILYSLDEKVCFVYQILT